MFRYLITVTVIFTLSISLGETNDWTSVVANNRVDFDLQATPLEIKAKPAGTVDVVFEGDQGRPAGGLTLLLDRNEFRVHNCNKRKAATTTFCKEGENIWRVTKVDSTGVEVTCNGDAMINLEFSADNCDEDSSWASKWELPITGMKFNGPSAAIAYRPAPADDKDDDKKQLSGANKDRGSFLCLATVFIAWATLWGF
jgi:hypothetical protein